MLTGFQLQIGARTIWMEARGEGRAGMEAVAWVIANRRRSGHWFAGLSVAACCLMPSQFSCWNTNDPNRMTMCSMQEDDPILGLCQHLLTVAIDGQSDDPVEGATHYYDTRIAPPAWTTKGTFVRQIGHHAFFKGIA